MTESTGSKDKVRVAILGAGPAGMTAAWELTSGPDAARYDITVYQMGWQAGGLCATGRIPPTYRVEQNGTHFLFGLYNAAFDVLKGVYTEIERRGIAGYGTYAEQLVPRYNLMLLQFFQGNWTVWPIRYPTNGAVPADGTQEPNVIDLFSQIVQLLLEGVCGWRTLAALQRVGVFPTPNLNPNFCQRIAQGIRRTFINTVNDAVKCALAQVLALLRALGGGPPSQRLLDLIASQVALLRATLFCLVRPFVDNHLELLRTWILIDLTLTTLIGFLRDDVLSKGWDSIDGYDLREWLARHGATEQALTSPPIAMWYDAIVNYLDGDKSRPNTSAGLALKSIQNIILRTKGTYAYQLSWQIGDSFIGPFYGALRARGVKFKFFQRVRNVIPGADGTSIQRIEIERQVRIREGEDAYEPFVLLNGRNVWPDRPRYEQLVDPITEPPHLYREFYSPPTGPTYELQTGKDFDVVVFAMPSSMIRFVAPLLVAQQPDKWGAMAAGIRRVQTQSLAIYWRKDLRQLGWQYGPAVTSAFTPEFSTWEDATPDLLHEKWPADDQPKNHATVLGPLPAPPEFPGPEDTQYPVIMQAAADAAGQYWLNNSAAYLWPDTVNPLAPPAVDRALIVQADVVASYGPLQAYLLVAAGTLKYRPWPADSGYANLVLAGDWTRNGTDVGSVEGAVQSGRLAGQAVREKLKATAK